MAEETLTQISERLKLSGRARKVITERFGSLGACADAIREKEVHPRHPSAIERGASPTYTLTGWRWGLQFRHGGVGSKTAAEITAALLVLGLVSMDDCGFGDEELADRRTLNEFLQKFGWTGPLLPGRRRGGKTVEEKRESDLARLNERREKLQAQLSGLEQEIAILEAAAS